MCGIAGYISRGFDSTGEKAVKNMMNRMIHRGPDSFGQYSEGSVFFGHRRLAIIDVTSAGHQPMVVNDIALTFNGEIYNFRELREELEELGHEFVSRSDTEVLLKSYLAWGNACVQRFRGMFAFAIWDGHRKTLICARDPFGKKPLYYHFSSGKFIFASEPEALVSGLVRRPEISAPGVACYLLKGYFPLGETIYQTIQSVPPGTVMTWDLSEQGLEMWRYTELKFSLAGGKPEVGRKNLVGLCDRALESSIDRRLVSDVPIGTLLSGGVDSSLVTLIAAEQSGPPLQSFTVSFEQEEFDETSYAVEVAKKKDINHHIVSQKMADLPETLENLVAAFGEPFGDPSAIPSYWVFNSLKNHVTVALTGDGGDEVFAGYKGFKLFDLRSKLSIFSGTTDLVPLNWMLTLTHNRSRRVREAGYFLAALRKSSSDAYYLFHQSGWTELWRKRAMRPEMWRATGESTIDQRDRETFENAGKGDMERYLNMMLERLAQYFLVKIDRTSMAHSIEARSPMLDIDLISLTQNLSPQQLIRGGEEKSLLKEILSARMGKKFSYRTKMGFTPPLEKWLRDESTRSWLERRLTDPESLSYAVFQPERIREMLYQENSADHSGRIWKLIFLNEWHRKAYLQ